MTLNDKIFKLRKLLREALNAGLIGSYEYNGSFDACNWYKDERLDRMIADMESLLETRNKAA